MKKPEVRLLIDLYTRICSCRDCMLAENCRPRLRPPGPGYKKGGLVFVQINPGYIGAMAKHEIQKHYKTVHNREIAECKINLTKDLLKNQNHFFKNPSIENYNTMVSLFNASRHKWGWPPGRFWKTIEGHGVEMSDVAIINFTCRFFIIFHISLSLFVSENQK